MSDFLDFSSAIDSQISFYERCLRDAKKVAHVRVVDGFDDGDRVVKFEGALTELRRLRAIKREATC